MKKRIISILLVFCTLCTMGATALAADSIALGTTANGQKWTLSADGQLAITGNGALPDYGYYVEGEDYDNMKYIVPEWNGYSNQITSVIIGEGITHVGSNAFGSQFADSGCPNLTTVDISRTVTSIGAMAFAGCGNLCTVNFYGDAPSLDVDAFAGISRYAVFYYPDGAYGWDSHVWNDFNLQISGTSSAEANSIGFSNFQKVNTYKAGQFSDIPSLSWYTENVVLAYELGLVKGSSATTFNPDGNITITETIALACRLHSIYYADGEEFLQGTPWYQVYVDYALENGIITSGQYSDYNVKATRAQFASIMATALPANAMPAINNVTALPDVSQTDNYANAVYLLYNAGVLTGSDSFGTFNAGSNIQRCEVAAIVARMAVPENRKTFKLERLKVDKTELTISEPTTVIASVHEDGVSLNCEYDTDIVDVKWGEWDGWTIPLSITPLKNGTTTIKLNIENDPSEYIDIIVHISGASEGTAKASSIPQDEVLLHMAALGINTAYQSAKYPSTLHLNCVTYSDKFVNGYGDTITRMVLRCYAANSLGGYGDLYVVVLCCEYETDYFDYYWDGLYFSTSCYSKDPGMESYYLNNLTAMNAYKSYIVNPQYIPYD